MASVDDGWIDTAYRNDIPDVETNSSAKRPVSNKIRELPCLNKQTDSLCMPVEKQWTDRTLFKNDRIRTYLTASNVFQRASLAQIIDKWKQREKELTRRQLSVFDIDYGMQNRFRQDSHLNGSSKNSYAAIGQYYRLLSDERQAKTNRVCVHHQRRTQQYEERRLNQLFKLATTIKNRHQPDPSSQGIELPLIKASVYH